MSTRPPFAEQPPRASALAPATRRAYESDWLVFASWCAQRTATAIPAAPATVAAFLAALPILLMWAFSVGRTARVGRG